MSRAVLVAVGLMLAVPMPAAARDVYGRYGRYDDAERVGYKRGFQEGVDEGRRDVRRGRSYNVRRHDDFRDDDDGYRREYGPRSEYRRGFRSGFQDGYREAYRSGGYKDDRYYDDDYRYRDGYDYRRDGSHRHRGVSAWCRLRH